MAGRPERVAPCCTAQVRPTREYHRRVTTDPLKSAVEDIAPRLDAELQPVVAALLADQPVEDAWEILLQEILDEA